MKYLVLLLIIATSHHGYTVEANSGASKKISAENSNDIFVCNTGDTVLKTYNGAIDAFNHLLPGQGVYLCRGGEFEVTRHARISRTSCEAEKVCTFGAYGEGPDPVVLGSGDMALTIQSEKGVTVKHLLIKDIVFMGEGYEAPNVTGISVSAKTHLEYIDFDNITIDGYHTGMIFRPASPTNHHVNMRNSKLLRNKGSGFLGGISDSILENNLFKNSGTGRSGHQIYVSGKGLKNFTVKGNTLDHNAPVGEVCNRGPLVAHGVIDGLLIENSHH